MRESRIENALVRGVKRAGGEVRKLVTPGRRHAPDRLVILPGKIRPPERDGATGWQEPARVIFVELKAPGKKPRPGQAREHARLRAMGCDVWTLNALDQVDYFIDTYR